MGDSELRQQAIEHGLTAVVIGLDHLEGCQNVLLDV